MSVFCLVSWVIPREMGDLIKKIWVPVISISLIPIMINVLDHLPYQQKVFAGIFSCVVFLWLFTEIPLFVSGTLGVATSVILGIVDPTEAFSPYANPVIFLFLAGFFLALGLSKSGLDKYFIDEISAHPRLASCPRRMALVLLLSSFLLSMWVSNTAAISLMLPVAISILNQERYGFTSEARNRILLGLAYATTIGANVTPIGSPPNALAIGQLSQLTGKHINFIEWGIVAAPIAAILLIFVVYFSIKDISIRQIDISQHNKVVFLLNPKQKWMLAIFFLVILFWIMPSLLTMVLPKSSDVAQFMSKNFSISSTGIFFGCLLFILPLFSKEKILNSKDLSQIDWGTLLLFGSGISLGKILVSTGLAEYMLSFVGEINPNIGPKFIFILIIVITIFFTEVASNTASANILIPLSIALAMKADVSPTLVAIIMAICCNSAFMLPVATPPNAIIYSTGTIDKGTMIRRGIILNLVACLLLTGIVAIAF